MNDFTAVMAKKSDAELLEIVGKLREDYQAKAVEAAEIEIENRNLSIEQLEEAQQEIQEKEAVLLSKEQEPLDIGQKILFLLFFWGVIPWAIAGTFKNNGYLKKYKDAWKFMKIGMAIFIGIPLLLILTVEIFV